MEETGVWVMRLVHPNRTTSATYHYDAEYRYWSFEIHPGWSEGDFSRSELVRVDSIQEVLDLMVQHGFFTADDLEIARHTIAGGSDGVVRARRSYRRLETLWQTDGHGVLGDDVIISVERQSDRSGFVVLVGREGIGEGPLSEFPTETYEEALSVAETMSQLVERGMIDVVVPQE